MELENIFTAPDIRIQLPIESNKFYQVDKFWKETMFRTKKRPLVEYCCKNEEMIDKFVLLNNNLEEI
jgi:dynein heavy chain